MVGEEEAGGRRRVSETRATLVEAVRNPEQGARGARGAARGLRDQSYPSVTDSVT